MSFSKFTSILSYHKYQSRKERKKMGIFYTPPKIVDLIINRTLETMLYNKIKLSENNLLNSIDLLFEDFYILDPAIGKGEFVLGILKWLNNTIKSSNINENELSKKKEKLIRSFLQKNLYGIEIDPFALESAKKRIVSHYPFVQNTDLSNLKNGNAIIDEDVYQLFNDELKDEIAKLFPFSWKKAFNNKKFDLIIGNPPYYNIKKVGLLDPSNRILYYYLKKSLTWKNHFRSSSDLYYYFIMKSLWNLKVNGSLAFIVPNYWIYNTYADRLREEILKNRVREVIDFEEFPIFYDKGFGYLSIASSIVIIEKSGSYQQNYVFNYSKLVKRDIKNIDQVTDVIQWYKINFHQVMVESTSLSSNPWLLSPHYRLLMKIKNGKNILPLSSVARVAQGVSPGVKAVFMLSNKEIEKFGIEKEVLVPFITSRQIQKWYTPPTTGLFAIFPLKIDNLEDFPNTYSYLLEHKEKLMHGPDRRKLIKKKKIRWFDYSVYRNIDLLTNKKPRLIVPYRSSKPFFSLDTTGFLCATDMYIISSKPNVNLLTLLGILNSVVIKFWLKEAGKKKGKMIELFSKSLASFPVAVNDNQTKIKNKVVEIIEVIKNNQYLHNEKIVNMEMELDKMVMESYNINSTDIELFLNKSYT